MASIKVERVDMQQSLNATAHSTHKYAKDDGIVLRRGGECKMAFIFSRPFNPNQDTLSITVGTGPQPSESTNTRHVMVASSSRQTAGWSLVYGSSNGNSLPVTMKSPVTAVVGLYTMEAKVNTSSFKMENFSLLFNAWHTDDDVYMADAALREEYILNELSPYDAGSIDSYGTYMWDLAQFEHGVLPACMALLARAPYHPTYKVEDGSNVMLVARILGAMVNSNDGDRGVLVGNWRGDYTGGTNPSSWSGSAPILLKWHETGTSVKFGQCWVYTGVLCTVCRCLGIPACMLTNMPSAHDTVGNLCIDNYYDASGRRIPSMSNGSVWNFHCWPLVWMIRRDLAPQYSGWQFVDGTPQEPSQGIYLMGPCSVTAVKEGDVNLPHDCVFGFGEVNCDMRYFHYSNGNYTLSQVDRYHVGRRISTKTPGSNTTMNITSWCKYPDGSSMETEVRKKAERLANPNRPAGFMMADREEEITPQFSASLTCDNMQYGQALKPQLVLTNLTDDTIVVEVKKTADCIIYTGDPMTEIVNESQTVTLQPKETKNISDTIPPSAYSGKLTDDHMIKYQAMCQDKNGGTRICNHVAQLKIQELKIEVEGNLKVNKQSNVKVSIANNFGEDLTNINIKCEGNGLFKNQENLTLPSLPKGQSHTFTFHCTPYRGGQRCLSSYLISDQIGNIRGYKTMSVAPE